MKSASLVHFHFEVVSLLGAEPILRSFFLYLDREVGRACVNAECGTIAVVLVTIILKELLLFWRLFAAVLHLAHSFQMCQFLLKRESFAQVLDAPVEVASQRLIVILLYFLDLAR